MDTVIKVIVGVVIFDVALMVALVAVFFLEQLFRRRK